VSAVPNRVEPIFMPEPNPKKVLAFTSPKNLNLWLRDNHATESELWIKIFKKKTGILSVTWDDIVLEALCWGWIDGIKKSVDDHTYLQRITPRKARSIWSKRNIAHVERLINEGRLMESGMAHVTAAKNDGRWDQAYAVSEIEVPEDFLEALEDNLDAKKFFETLTRSSRYVIAHGLLSARKPETRKRRFDIFMDMLDRSIKP